jgi:hypothetical protein
VSEKKPVVTHDPQREQEISDAISAIVERRAVIEQTKGMLMFLYGVDADEAFEMLRVQSQLHNVKLGLIAEQMMKDLVELAKSNRSARRLDSDGLLLTAHCRVADVAERQLDGQSRTG